MISKSSMLLVLAVSAWLSSPACSQRPNIIVINLDDADRDMLVGANLSRKFPAIGSLAVTGMSFTNFYVCSPKCGPSRACLLRGQYAHSINQRTNTYEGDRNRGFNGGFQNFLEQGYYHDDIGKWMRNGGYETVFMGKYLNDVSEFTVPDGWDHFYLSRGAEYYETHRFTNRDRLRPRKEKLPPGVYRTDAEVADLLNIIDQDLSPLQPFFIYYAPFGPHSEGQSAGGMVAEELADMWPNIRPIKRADYDEKDNSDKPPVYRDLPPLTFEDSIDIQVQHRNRMLSVKSVDNGLRKIIHALQNKGLYENTYFFITSDNGYSLGQHRLKGKGNSLSRSSNVPLIVSGPGIPANTKRTALTTQIDLAPTFLELASLSTKPFFDGKSLTPILFSQDDLAAQDFRTSILVENWELTGATPRAMYTTFYQLRTPFESYTQWADGTREYYDHSVDPLELRNRADELDSGRIALFRDLIERLRRPMTEPLCTFENPALDYVELAGPPFLLQGVAEDSDRVDKVELVIRNLQTQDFWNGESWQAERSVVNANLDNPEGILTQWNYRFDPPEPANPREAYVVTARAFSSRGNFNRKTISRRLKYDSLNPVTTQKNPRVRPNRRVALWGTATDNRQVRHVELVIQNTRTGEYYRAGDWFEERTSFNIRVDEAGDWEWVSRVMPAGSYVARARAVDMAGNFEASPQVRTFDVE